jgi:branched-chain amino acid transport system permease protein
MQIFINGLISGFGIALLAVAFQAVYLPTRVFFLGLAGVYAAVPFFCLEILQRTGHWWLAVPAAIAFGVGVSLLAEATIHRYLEMSKAPSGAHLVASLGTYIVLVQSISMIWGNNPKSLRQGLDSVTRIGEVVVTGAQWVMLCGAALSILSFILFLVQTKAGVRMRALADNPVQFSLYQHSVPAYRFFAFGIAGCLAGFAAVLTAYDVGFNPHAGLHSLLLAIISVIVGGRSTFVGPMLGGILLGITRSQVVWHLSARWQEAVSFGLLVTVLIFLPNGLLGGRKRLEAAT